MSDHQWYYMKKGLLEDEQVGPVSEKQLLNRIRAGEIKPKTVVGSPTRTNGNWFEIREIPGLMSAWQEGVRERKEAAKRRAEEIQLERKRQQGERARQEQELEEEEKRRRKAAIAHKLKREEQARQREVDLISRNKKLCPFCSEEIERNAAKCKHCGEFLDEHLRAQQAYAAAPMKWNPGVAAVLSLFFPGVGQIYKGQVGNGLDWMLIVAAGYFFGGGCLPSTRSKLLNRRLPTSTEFVKSSTKSKSAATHSAPSGRQTTARCDLSDGDGGLTLTQGRSFHKYVALNAFTKSFRISQTSCRLN